MGARIVVTASVLTLFGVASAQAAAPSALVGTWTHTVTASAWSKAGAAGFPVGRWKIVVAADGVVNVYTPGGTSPDFSTTFSARGTTLTVGAVPVCATNGRYRWSSSNRTLHLTPIADKSCGPRLALFTGAWTKR